MRSFEVKDQGLRTVVKKALRHPILAAETLRKDGYPYLVEDNGLVPHFLTPEPLLH